MALTRGVNLTHIAEPLPVLSNFSTAVTLATGTVQALAWDFGINDMMYLQPAGSNDIFGYSLVANVWGRMGSVTTNANRGNIFYAPDTKLVYTHYAAGSGGLYSYNVQTKTSTSLTGYSSYSGPVPIHPNQTQNAAVVSNDFFYMFRSTASQKYSVSGNSWSAIVNTAFNIAGVPGGAWCWGVTGAADFIYVVDRSTTYAEFGLCLRKYTISTNTFSVVADDVQLVPHFEQTGVMSNVYFYTLTYSATKIYIGAWYTTTAPYVVFWEIDPTTVASTTTISAFTRVDLPAIGGTNMMGVQYALVGGTGFLYVFAGSTTSPYPAKFFRVPIY